MRTIEEITAMQDDLMKRVSFFNATARRCVDERNWEGAKRAAEFADELKVTANALDWVIGDIDEL